MSLLIENGLLSVRISPLGAELISLTAPNGEELMWNADPSWWGRSAPILFPVIGRLGPDEPVFPGARAPLPLHGVASDSLFTVVSHTREAVTLSLSENAKTRRVYPHPFRLAVTFQLAGGALSIETEVHNPACSVLPYAFGFHPGFSCDTRAGTGRLEFDSEESTLVMHAREGRIAAVQASSPLMGRHLTLTPEIFSEGAIVFAGARSRRIKLHRPERQSLAVRFNTPHLAIWSRPAAPFVCIEPWAGLPTCAGIPSVRSLPPGGRESFLMKIDTSYTPASACRVANKEE